MSMAQSNSKRWLRSSFARAIRCPNLVFPRNCFLVSSAYRGFSHRESRLRRKISPFIVASDLHPETSSSWSAAGSQTPAKLAGFADRENPSRVTPGCHFYFQHLLFTLCAPIARVSSPFVLRRTRLPRAARNKIEEEHYLARGLFSGFWILQSFARRSGGGGRRRRRGTPESSRNART